MAYAFPELKTFAGIYLQANSFTVPDGALEAAENCVMTNDKVVSKQRGSYLYYDPGVKTLNNLATYQNTLIGAFSDSLAYFSETGSDPSKTGVANFLSGSTVSLTGTRIARFFEANKSLFATSDNGVLKLEAYNSSIFTAGAPPALDIRGFFLPANGPIVGDTEVGYRAIFGRLDGNNIPVDGAPGDILVLTNAKVVGSAYSLATNVVTVTTASAHNLVTGMTINASNDSNSAVTAATYTVTVTGTTTFTFPFTHANISGTIDYSASRQTRLELSVPSDVVDGQGYYVQIYRTSQTASGSASPAADFKLLIQHALTTAEVTARVVFYDDNSDDILLGAELYTNPNSREGELQSNDRPPLCDDICLYKTMAIYLGLTTRQYVDLQVVAAGSLASGDYVEVKVDATTRRYVARTGRGNLTTTATSVSGTTTIVVTYAAHGLLVGDTVYVSNVAGTVTVGTYTLTAVTTNTFTFVATAGQTATGLDFQGVTNGTYPIFILDSSSSSAAVQLRNTAQGLVKAINRDTSSLVYARYTSSISGVPGMFRLQAKGFTGVIYVRASATGAASAFAPTFPTAFNSGTQVFSRNDTQPNAFAASKVSQAEAVPLVNVNPGAGSKSKAIVRGMALRDSLILIKQDGVFRVTGDTPESLTITPLDLTVICISPNSVKQVDNQVYFLSNQGVARVTDTTVDIISHNIRDMIQPILGLATIDTLTGAVGYESDHLYFLSTAAPNEPSTWVTHIANVFTGAWTTSTTLFRQGIIGPSDKLYMVTTGNQIYRERKDQTKVDYCGQNYTASVTSVAADNLSAVITAGAAPKKGWVLIKDNLFSRISAVTGSGPYTVTFTSATNLVAADSPQLYASYKSTIMLAPYHGGIVGRMKQFASMAFILRSSAASELSVWFASQYFGSSRTFDWVAKDDGTSGWGQGPFGYFPWGNVDSINLDIGTQASTPGRTLVPIEAQRTTWIQPVIEHDQAGEPLNLQAITWAVRSYGERIAR